MTRVTGGIVVTGGPLVTLMGKASAFQPDTDHFDSNPASLFADSSDRQQQQQPSSTPSGCSDTDPSDPALNGRNCRAGGTPPSPPPPNQPTVGTYSGCTDSDTGSGYDRPGYGRRCSGGATTTDQPTVGTYSGCTDSDTGSGYDRPGYGRRCSGGTPPPPPPPPPPPSGNQTYTGCSDSDSGANYDRGGYGRNCTTTTDPGGQTPTGCTDSDTGPNADRAQYGRNCGGQQAQIRAWLDPDCVPLAITISELPSRTCTINIAGFRRNTADRVEVILPAATDGFGNHANGIQVVFSGSGDVYDWPDVYRWTIFVFACPGQRGTGANCYGSVTTPGSLVVPIIVRQRGAGEARVNLQVNATGGPGGGLQFPSAQRIESAWARGNFINVERGFLEAGPIQPNWDSAFWWLVPAQDFPGFVRLQSRWQQTWFMHIERGQLECSPIATYWRSALWAIETPRGGNLVRFRNGWRQDLYIDLQGGLAVRPVSVQQDSSYWIVQ